DLKYLLNEALRYALFDGRTYVTMRDIRMAQPEHEMGLRTPIKNLSNEDKRRLAAHEGGHAMAIRLFRPNYRISRVTIIRQGGAQSRLATRRQNFARFWRERMNRLRVVSAGSRRDGICGRRADRRWYFGDASDFCRFSVLYEMANAVFGLLGANMGHNAGPARAVGYARSDGRPPEVLDEVRMASGCTVYAKR
ncbi:MAG: hypothetical protein LC121_20090, partial [Anaerolineae bacterium]|nr:hypothetical protein [Anaerolineae bacterium]